MRILIATLFCLVSIVSGAIAINDNHIVSVEEIAANARKIQEQERQSVEDFLSVSQKTTDEQRVSTAEILSISHGIVKAAMDEEAQNRNLDEIFEDDKFNEKLLVFITLGEAPDYAHGKKMINALLDMPKETIIVLRGLPDGMRQIDAAARVVNALVEKNLEDLPPVIMDPTRFKKYAITGSPTLLIEKAGEEVARLAGQLSYEHLINKVESGYRGDLGVFGSTAKIIEKDFIKDLEERITAIDWNKKKQKAYKRYWTKKAKATLPPAPEDNTFAVTPIFELTADILDHEGNVLAHKGERFNTLTESLKSNPTLFYLIVFDGSDPDQIEIAKALLKNAPAGHKKLLITTVLSNPDNGWEEFPKLQEEFKSAVYLLDERFINTFELKHVPCTVEPLQSQYIIKEYRSKL